MTSQRKVYDTDVDLGRSVVPLLHGCTATLLLINGSHGPGLVFHADWPPAASHHYSSSVSPPRLCLWVSVVHKCVCLCFVQNVGFPTMKNPATCVNHTLFVWWSSARGPHGNSDVTHTETSIWTTPMLDDKQIIRDEIQVPILVDDCLGSLQTVSLWLDDAGHTTGG